VDFRGLALPILTLEDPILLKALAGHLPDQADLERIKERPDLRVDWEYVNTWLARLGLSKI
jgi:predicted nucleotidyltransferase